jgi:glycosyltransferase involved in cell wall biosynthesis
MKIAVFDTVLNPGGGLRYISNLLPAIKKARPEVQISFYCDIKRLKGYNYYKILTGSGIRVENLNPLKPDLLRRLIGFALKKLIYGPLYTQMDHEKRLKHQIEKLSRDFDLAFFPWPYLILYPETKCPKVGTFHDFNFKYFFGSAVYPAEHIEKLETQMPLWLRQAVPIVSTDFMKAELLKFYPAAENTQVIPLAPLAAPFWVDRQQAEKNVANLAVKGKYFLYPTNISIHKNIGTLCTAIYLLNLKGYNIKLVLTGEHTQLATGKAGPYGVNTLASEPDVIGLGYVGDEEIDSLIQCAAAVVSCSLYEAGNGPGLDAWSRGTPVAMSDIPAFREHLEIFSVRAQVFEPHDPKDIADKLEYILKNEEQVKNDADISRQNISRYNWSDVAEKYCNVFDLAIEKGEKGN